MEKLGWLLIGASHIAREWMVDAIRGQPDAEILAVYSKDADRAGAFAAQFGIAHSYTDLYQALAHAGVRAVYISSTNDRHAAQACAAAAAGKAVLCEKPLATNLQDAQQMLQACSKAGVLLATNHHLRNAATHRMIKTIISDGAIGIPLYARVFHAVSLPPNLQGWRLDDSRPGGGVILDISVHDIDTLRFVLGDEPVSVTAQAINGGSFDPPARHATGVMAIVQFASGLMAQIHDAFDAPHTPTGLEIIGTKGSIRAPGVMTARQDGEVWLNNGDGEVRLAVEHENLYSRAVQQFLGAMRGKGVPAATGQDGLRSLAAALAIQQAAESGMRVQIARS